MLVGRRFGVEFLTSDEFRDGVADLLNGKGDREFLLEAFTTLAVDLQRIAPALDSLPATDEMKRLLEEAVPRVADSNRSGYLAVELFNATSSAHARWEKYDEHRRNARNIARVLSRSAAGEATTTGQAIRIVFDAHRHAGSSITKRHEVSAAAAAASSQLSSPISRHGRSALSPEGGAWGGFELRLDDGAANAGQLKKRAANLRMMYPLPEVLEARFAPSLRMEGYKGEEAGPETRTSDES